MEQKKYILIAHENFGSLFLVKECLIALGFGPGTVEVEGTNAGQVALDLFEQRGKPLFAMIGRQFKFEMTGDELLSLLLKKHPDLQYFRIASDPNLVTDDLHPIELRGLGVWDGAGLASLKKLLAQRGLV